MDERARAGFAGEFAAVDEFAWQAAEAHIERGVHSTALGHRHSQRVDVKFFPVSRMNSYVHNCFPKIKFYPAPARLSQWRATNRWRLRDIIF